ncbi:DUF4303 domain-containing protein [Streptomyces zhihengii]
MEFDWSGLEKALIGRVTDFVRRLRAEHPQDRLLAAAVHEFYAESGGVIACTCVGAVSEESLASVATDRFTADDLRWSPADWPWQLDPGPDEDAWSARLTAEATAGGGHRWDEVHDRYLRTVAAACHTARRDLVADGAVPDDFVVVALDEAWDLVPLSVTPEQLRTHFPELVAEQRESERLDALPPQERAAELIAVLDAPTGTAPLGSDEVAARLRALGPAAVPGAVDRLLRSREKWLWAKLLAELGVASADVLDALTGVLRNRRLREPDRAWAAAALARLGRTDIVTAALDRLPDTVAVRGLTAPYTSFRDIGAHGPLDYRPLEQALAAHPALHDAVFAALRPGTNLCAVAPEETETCLGALTSPWPVVRCHAVLVLEDAPLTGDGRARYTAALARLRLTDPDPTVRTAATRVTHRTGGA